MDDSRARAFEPWMLSNLVSGAVMGSFMVLLIPPFITDVTGSAGRVGVVFAVISLAALSGPVFGRIADRFRMHRLLYTASFVGMAVTFAIFAVDDAHQIYSPIAGILLGTSMAAKSSIGSGMLVGSGLPAPVQARQLTVFNLMIFGGQIVGGVLVAVLSVLGVGARAEFWIVSVILLATALFTWVTTALPQRRLAGAPEAEAASASDAPAERVSFGRMVRSPFGVLLAVVLLGGLSLSIMSSQIANIMPKVFHIDESVTSLLVATGGLLGIPAVLLTGTWMVLRGPGPALVTSVVARGIGLAAMAVLGLFAGGAAVAVLAGVMYLAVTVSSSLQRSPMPRAAAILSPAGPSEANGMIGAAGALGAFIGCLGAGIVADLAGFEAVLWLSGIAGLLALLLVPQLGRAVARRAPGATPTEQPVTGSGPVADGTP